MPIQNWSVTPADNATADLLGSGINWQEGQLPSTVNNSARAMMAEIKKATNDLAGTIATTGSGGAYSATTAEGWTTLAAGRRLRVRANHTNPGTAPTFNINTTGSIEARSAAGDSLGKSAIRSGELLDLLYDGTYWIIEGKSINPLFAGGRYVEIVGGTANAITLTTGAALAGLAPGMEFSFKALANSTAMATIAIDGNGPFNTKRPGGSATQQGDFVAGTLHTVEFDGTDLITTGASAASADVLARIISVGDVIISASATPRAGWVRLKETAQALNKADYPELDSWASGQGYPWGSAALTFNVPPAAGYLLRFAASDATVDPSGARAAGSTQADSIKSHTHTASGTTSSAGAHTHTGTTTTDGAHTHSIDNSGNLVTDITTSGSQTAVGTASDTTGSAGSHNHDLNINSGGSHTHTLTLTVDATGVTETVGKNVAFHADMLASPALASAAATGVYGLTYKWSTGLSGNPSSGFLGLDNATYASATELRISDTDGVGAVVNDLLNIWDDGGGPIRCVLHLSKIGAPSQFLNIAINGALTDFGAYKSFPVQFVASFGGSFSNGDNLAVSYFLSMGGAAGADGFFSGSEPYKTTLDAADELFLADSADGGAPKRILKSDLVTAIGGGGGGVSDGDKGDITISGTGSTYTIDPDVVTNAKLANVATATLKGRATAGTGDPEDLTGAQATALLSAMVGDSGSGGTKGLVPAPVAGDAAGNKFLKADGTWASPPGGGGGGLSDGDYGDITVSGTGTAMAIDPNVVTNSKLADMATQTFKGRTSAGSGDPEDLSVAQAKTLLNLTGTNSGDQTITLTGDVTGTGSGSFAATIANNAVTNAKAADMATATIKGRTTAGTGDPEDLTAAQATALLDVFASGTKGLAPASGGGTANFLRADGTWAAPGGGGGGSPGGSDTQMQYNDGGAFGGAADVTYDDATGALKLAKWANLAEQTSDPALPSGSINLFAKKIANRRLPRFNTPLDSGSFMQPFFATQKIGIIAPAGNSSLAPTVLGMVTPTAVGTLAARNVVTISGNMLTRTRRLGIVSAATAASTANIRGVAAQYALGNGSGLGGFFFSATFNVSDVAILAAARMFVGMTSKVTAITDVEPSTLINCIGVGAGSADTNLKMFYGGSAAQTPIDLGANFPSDTTNTDLYRLILFSSSSENAIIYYEVQRLNTGDVATGTISGTVGTQVPNNTTLLTYQAHRSNAGNATAVAFDYSQIYIETEQ